jgi:hypothetical protein
LSASGYLLIMSLYSDCSELYSCSQNCSYAGICALAILTHVHLISHSCRCMANKRPCHCTLTITPAQPRRLLLLNTEMTQPFSGSHNASPHHTSKLVNRILLATNKSAQACESEHDTLHQITQSPNEPLPVSRNV